MNLFYTFKTNPDIRIKAGSCFTPNIDNAVDAASGAKTDIYMFRCPQEMLSTIFERSGEKYISKCHIRTNCCDKLMVLN